ncbi:hypothetical protein IWQ62_001886 [Dispira parvispora]|uniref:RRM domain-containing protein n=1 Tax=Dispira parvispora TaxID=1520584 RepID=A0A9W8E8K8_9FUNG|nr:hypothetical protein IWQ62_001886 [Dispira parvispora]
MTDTSKEDAGSQPQSTTDTPGNNPPEETVTTHPSATSAPSSPSPSLQNDDAAQPHAASPSESIYRGLYAVQGKVFVGGLSWETTVETLGQYFSQFGTVLEHVVMRDPVTGRSRGFGFVRFKEAEAVDAVLAQEHYLDGKRIEPKRAIPEEELPSPHVKRGGKMYNENKVFVGHLPVSTTQQEFTKFFEQFGQVQYANVMRHPHTGKSRGFGFVKYADKESYDNALSQKNLVLGSNALDVKPAESRPGESGGYHHGEWWAGGEGIMGHYPGAGGGFSRSGGRGGAGGWSNSRGQGRQRGRGRGGPGVGGDLHGRRGSVPAYWSPMPPHLMVPPPPPHAGAFRPGAMAQPRYPPRLGGPLYPYEFEYDYSYMYNPAEYARPSPRPPSGFYGRPSQYPMEGSNYPEFMSPSSTRDPSGNPPPAVSNDMMLPGMAGTRPMYPTGWGMEMGDPNRENSLPGTFGSDRGNTPQGLTSSYFEEMVYTPEEYPTQQPSTTYGANRPPPVYSGIPPTHDSSNSRH